MKRLLLILALIGALIVTSDSQCTNNDIRLIWGNGNWEGNIQICINGAWGWVCDNSFGTPDAKVACKQLGFQTTGAAYRLWSYYGLGNVTTPLVLDGLNCAGTENKIIDCPRPYPVGTTSCGYNEIAGIVCPSGGSCTGNQIRRLRNNNGTPFRGNGRVEMCYNGQWGRVCDDSWGGNDAKVACFQLGFTKSRVASYCCSRYFGPGYGQVVYDQVQCSSAESTLLSCNSLALGTYTGCNGNQDAGIGCYGTIPGSCTNGDVKLWRPSDGPEYFGLALYCKNNAWTGVCDDSFTCHTARLFCQQLGFPGAWYYRGEGYWGYFYSTLGNGGVDHYAWSCGSSHTSLSQCSYYYHSSCNAYHDQFGIMCTPNIQRSDCTDGQVRIVNGTSSSNGRVEYCFEGGWSALCGMSAAASTAICRSLGFNTSFAVVYNDERYGRSNYLSNLNYLNCPKSATSVTQCTPVRIGAGGCWSSVRRCGKEYSVQCFNNLGQCTDGSFRLVNGTIEQEGRIEVCTNGLWGAVCHGRWNAIDAYVMCRSLGYSGQGPTTFWYSKFGLATGPAPWKNVNCFGWEKSLFDCQKTIYPYDSCPILNIVGVACKDGCSNGDVRLVGGNFENEGTVQVCYNGRWGQVSDQQWDANDARVVCNQLGYTGGNAVATTGSQYGKSNLTIHLKFVGCTGTEISLDLCSKTKLSLNNGKLELATANTAGVDCIYDVPTDPPCVTKPASYNSQGAECGAAQNRTVRLMGTNQQNGYGRLEYCLNGWWSPFCYMDTVVATVACNDLGYTGYTWGSILEDGNYGIANIRNISLFYKINCTGSESSISGCSIIINPSCTPYCARNLGLRCFDPTQAPNQCTTGAVRLADGIIDNEGRVEVCVNGVWGTVCDQGWDKTDAHVVCQQLGHPELEPYIFTNSTFGDGQFPIVYSNMGCVGYENTLSDCSNQVYPLSTCSRKNVAGLLCGYDCTDGDVRLVGSQWSYEGTVEICFDNLWGLISDSAWSLQTAQVICQQLGYQAEGTLAIRGSQYGKPNNLTIHFRDVTCTGEETAFSDCSYSTLSLAEGKAMLATTDVAGVKCYTPDHCIPPPNVTGSDCTTGAIRLSGGQGGIPEGNLEFCYRGYWSPFCYLGPMEATVACRQLGYSNYDLSVVFSDGRFGAISNTSLFQNISCVANPNAGLMTDCQITETCQSRCQYAVGLRCYESGNCQEGDVRLVNGSFTTEGRVEVCSNGIWGSICSTKFTAIDAYVICKELGYGLIEPIVYNNSYYGDGDTSIVLSEVDCKGYEPTVLDCNKKTYGQFTCSRDNIIGIICQENCNDGDIRLSGSVANTEGTVQYCYYSTWGLISDNSWNDPAAQVVCKQLGYQSGVSVSGSQYGKPNRTIILSTVGCTGSETTLQDCQSTLLSPDDGRTLYPHVGVAGVMCQESTTPTATTQATVLSNNSAGIGLAIVMVLLVLTIVATIGMVLYVYFMRQKVLKTNAVLSEPRVKMSGLGDTGVSNPMEGLDEDGMDDFNTADQDELVDRLNKM